MRVLGIDPGSHNTGWGVIQTEGSRLCLVAAGVVRGGPRDAALATRLGTIGLALEALLREHAPEVVAVENVFHAHNPRSALVLGQARGVALYCAARAGLPVFEYTPSEIKQGTTGRGRADKTQVQHMVRVVLGTQQRWAADASDALAAAICHVHHAPYQTPYHAAQSARRTA